MSQSESRRVAHCMYVEIEFKKKKNFDFESLVLRKFRKITAISGEGGGGGGGRWGRKFHVVKFCFLVWSRETVSRESM